MRYKTQNRHLILNYLMENSDIFFSVQDIQQELTRLGNSVNISTIYRYLDTLLNDQVIVRHVDPITKKSCFRYADNECVDHLHMKCKFCGITFHLPADLLSPTAILHNFKVEYEHSIVQGTCENCKN